MEPFLEQLKGLGPVGLVLAFIGYMLIRPPPWAQKLVEAKIEAVKAEANLLALILEAQGKHTVAIVQATATIKEMVADFSKENRHSENNALERVNANTVLVVTEAREYLCERIDESLAKAAEIGARAYAETKEHG